MDIAVEMAYGEEYPDFASFCQDELKAIAVYEAWNEKIKVRQRATPVH